MDLTTMYFTVKSIDGDYAHLKRIDEEGEKLVFILTGDNTNSGRTEDDQRSLERRE